MQAWVSCSFFETCDFRLMSKLLYTYTVRRDCPRVHKLFANSIDSDLTAALIDSGDIEIPMCARVLITFSRVCPDWKKTPSMLCSAFAFWFPLCMIMLVIMVHFWFKQDQFYQFIRISEWLTLIEIVIWHYTDYFQPHSVVSPLINPSMSISSMAPQ